MGRKREVGQSLTGTQGVWLHDGTSHCARWAGNQTQRTRLDNQRRTEIDTHAQIISFKPRSKAPSTRVASRQTPYTAKKAVNAGRRAAGMPQWGHRLTARTSVEKRSSIAALLAAYSDPIRGSSLSSSIGSTHSSSCEVPPMGMEEVVQTARYQACQWNTTLPAPPGTHLDTQLRGEGACGGGEYPELDQGDTKRGAARPSRHVQGHGSC